MVLEVVDLAKISAKNKRDGKRDRAGRNSDEV